MQAKFVSPLHEEAVRLAEAGTPVFPCKPGSKKPASDHGFKDATTDRAQIDTWWREDPQRNIAFSPQDVGLSVVDLDGPVAHEEWTERQIAHGFAPETYTVSTPRAGGQHLYFKGALPQSQGNPTAGIAPHIDTRGVGSYALVPPSVIDARGEPDKPEKWGTYRVESGSITDAAPVPEWIAPLIESKKRAKVASSGAAGLDEPGNVARAEKLLRDYVARGHVAVEDEKGNNRTFIVACEVQNLGVSEETAFKLISDVWNPACVPPWDEAELAVIVSSAARNAQNEHGAWAVGSAADVFGSTLGSLGLDDAAAEPVRSRFRPMSMRELDELPDPTWLIPDLIPEDGVTMFYGQPGSYKSFLVLMYCLELARAGKRVVYAAGEGVRGLKIRRNAWGTLHDVEVRDLPLWLVPDVAWVADGGQLQEFIDEVKPFKPDFVVIDTVARAMTTLNENDAKDMGQFVAYADTIKRALRTTVGIIHHSGKDPNNPLPRGSGALIGGVDAMHEVKADKTAHTVEVWVRRVKDAEERAHPWTYRVQSLAGSAVLIPTSSDEHRSLTHVDDGASATKVGAALRRMGAVGNENGVTTRALAAELVPAGHDETPEAREQAVSRLARTLTARASGVLEAYALIEGRERSWCLPA